MSDWTRFRARIERARRGNYESLVPEHFPPLQVFLGGGRPRQLLYFTKAHLCTHWMLHGQFPPGWVALVRYGFPTEGYLEEIRGYARRLSLPLHYVGELDPIDLTIFLMLRQGNADLSTRRATSIQVEYHGASDLWLRLRRRGSRVTDGSLGMERLERQHHEFVKSSLPGLEQLVGPECFALLESGRKLEIEGACDPSVAGRDFLSRLLSFLNKSR